MRYAVLSDIHSNLVALQAVLADLSEEEIDAYLCLGDIVGYGARPNQCCDIIRDLEAVCVRGNHDSAAVDPARAQWFTAPARACLLWTTDQLRDDNLEFLGSLPTVQIVDDHITICHGSIPDPDHYTVRPVDALMSFRAMKTPIAFFGHTHYSEWFVWSGDSEMPEEFPMPDGGELTEEVSRLYLVNPGAVGQPRDRNERASYAIYDADEGRVEIRRVSYDIALAAEQMKDAGLPEAMYARLWMGV